MADPISIIGLVGTAGPLTKTLLDYASSVKDAPKELEGLKHEFMSLQYVFEKLDEFMQREDGKKIFKEDSALYDAAGDMVVTLERLRTKFEKLSTAKGWRKVYNHLKWPIDGPDTRNLLQTIRGYTQTFDFALTLKGSMILSQDTRKASEMLRASQQIAQAQSETLRVLSTLSEHTDTGAELKQSWSRLHDDKVHSVGGDQDLLEKLSTLDFTTMQKDSYSKRCASTGHWLLESPSFQTWLSSEGCQHSVLWCPGAPGVGKTVITSVAVNYVTEITGGRRSAVVYIYCDYANAQTFSVESLLGSMVRQLLTQTSDADTVAEFLEFVKQTGRNRNLTKEDLSFWFEDLSRNFDVVYIVVDALDECPEIGRGPLLTRLQKFSEKNIRVFLTSRLNVNVIEQIPRAMRVDISATDHDITAFVESKIDENDRLKRFTARDPELKEHIVKRIINQAAGMFLLAGPQARSLGNQVSARGVRSALERLPTKIFTMYDGTIQRIRDQPKEDAELGMKVLSMILGATRPLKVDELRYALAIESGDTQLDYDAVVDVEILLGVTAGLVITYQPNDHSGERKWCRFVHYTLQEYLEAHQKELFPSLELDMARVCLSYLSLDEFWCAKCARKDLVYKSWIKFCEHSFIYYAATNWTHHLRGVQMELMDQSLALVQDSAKNSIWLEAFEASSPYDMSLSRSEDPPLDPIFLAAHFHLSELFTRLISSRDINTRNNRGETPLIRAVNVQTWQKNGSKPSDAHVSDAKMSRKGESPFCFRSLESEQYGMVQVILDHDADIDAKDSLGLTATARAIVNENGGILTLLLDRGANIDVRFDCPGDVELGDLRISSGGMSLVHIAASNKRRVDILQILLDRGADVNALDTYGASPLHVAVDRPNSAILDCLIDYGALLDVTDEYGDTPLLLAVTQGNTEAVTALIKRGARLDIKDSMGRSHLHLAIDHPWPDVVRLVLPAQGVDVVDVKGRTPLHYAYFHAALVLFLFPRSDSEKYTAAIPDSIRQLIEGGASETIVDADGRIPKDYWGWCIGDHWSQWHQPYFERISEAEEKYNMRRSAERLHGLGVDQDFTIA